MNDHQSKRPNGRTVGERIVGIIHAYPTDYLLDSLAKDGWGVSIVVPNELKDADILQHSALIDIQHCNFEEPAQVIQAALRSHQNAPWLLALPVNEGTVDLTAQLSERLNLPGNSVFAANASRDKSKSYEQFQRCDIPHPKSVVANSHHEAIAIAEQFDYPLILKLSDSMNSQGVIRANNGAEYQSAVAHLFAMFDNKHGISQDRNSYAYGKSGSKVVIQPFCAEEEIGIDLLYSYGEACVLGVFEKSPSKGPYFAEVYSISPSSLSNAKLATAIDVAKKAVFALGATLGAAHVEIRFHQGLPYVLEVGLRPGGGYTAIACEQLTGINSFAALANLLLNGTLPVCMTDTTKAILYGGILYPKNGVLYQVTGEQVISQTPGLIDWVTLGKTGEQVMTMPHAAQPHYAYYLLEGTNRNEVLKQHHTIQRQIGLHIDTERPPCSEFITQGQAILADIENSHIQATQKPVYHAQSALYQSLNNIEPLPIAGEDLANVLEQAKSGLQSGYANVQHPGYLGYISPKPDLNSILGDLLAAGHNQTPGAWRAGPFATVVERQVIAWLCELCQFPIQQGNIPNGIITNGGAMANATALKLARERKLGAKVKDQGLYCMKQLRFYGSVESHFSIARSLDFLGMGKNNLVTIPCNLKGQIDIELLEAQICQDIDNGYQPCALIAIAGTTATGQVDPIDKLHQISEKYDLWLHVDGAAGAVFAGTPATAALFNGIDKADSLCVDPCKWLFQSFGIGCLLVQNGHTLLESFNIGSHYWEEQQEPDFFQMGLTGTRQWRSLGLWFSIKTLGRDGIRQQLSHIHHCARLLGNQLSTLTYIEVHPYCELAVCVFRLKANDLSVQDKTKSNQLNSELQQWLLEQSNFFLSELDVKGTTYLRAAVSNTHTATADIERLVTQITQFNLINNQG